VPAVWAPQICLWCWHNIMENVGARCPACRTSYDKEIKAPNPTLATQAKAEARKQKSRERDREREVCVGDHRARTSNPPMFSSIGCYD
jgi:hypothetical protein